MKNLLVKIRNNCPILQFCVCCTRIFFHYLTYSGTQIFIGEQMFNLAVKVPTSQIRMPGFSSCLWFLTSASHQCRPWEAAVIAQVIGFLLPMGGLNCTLGSSPRLVMCGHLESEQGIKGPLSSSPLRSLPLSFPLPFLCVCLRFKRNRKQI